MHSLPRRFTDFLPRHLSRSFTALCAALMVLASPPLLAQSAEKNAAPPSVASQSSTPGDTPWLYENSDIPVDRSWTFGALGNGLRYAVKRNIVPAEQVSIRIRIDAGSLMEGDQELGFAHLIEHLAIRGSQHVPDGESQRVWQRLGATIGRDSNGVTTPTQTVYQIDIPRANAENLDQAMKILAGMMRAPTITPESVAAEGAVVLAELQDRAGPQMALDEASRALFYDRQLLATRPTIGTSATLRQATADAVAAFHRRWYRPEFTVVAIAGDAPSELLEKLVQKYFGDWQGQGAPAAHPDFGDPQPDSATSAVHVEPTFPHFLNLATLRPWRKVDDTIVYNQGLLIDQLALLMINRRLESRARGGGKFLEASVSQSDVARSVDATFVSVLPVGENWQDALRDVRAVIADALASPPSPEDIEREVANFDALLKVRVEGYLSEPARDQVEEIVRAVDIRETVATPQTALDVFRAMRPIITPERVLAATQALFTGTTTRTLLVAPAAAPAVASELAGILAEDVVVAADARIDQQQIRFADLPPIGKRGKVKSTRRITDYDMEIVQLSNGVRVLLFPNQAERNKILVNARFGGGYRQLPKDGGPLAWSGETALLSTGFGELDLDAIDRLVTGKRISWKFAIDEAAFELSGETRAVDLREQLYLLAAKLRYPRWDAAPIERLKAASLIGYDSYLSSPAALLERDQQWLLRDQDVRWKAPDKAEIASLTPERFRAYWEPVLASGPVELMLFGDFTREEALAAIADTFGALPKRGPAKLAEANGFGFPSPSESASVVRHRGDPSSAAAIAAWPTAGGIDSVRTGRELYVLADIFNARLFEQLRSEAGASYSPQAYSYWPQDIAGTGQFIALSQTTPDKVDVFYRLVEKIAADLRDNPVSADELARVVTPLRNLIERALTANQFWLIQLKGATYDPRKFDNLRTFLSDHSAVTPERLQQLARQYLTAEGQWRYIILPEQVDSAAIESVAGRE